MTYRNAACGGPSHCRSWHAMIVTFSSGDMQAYRQTDTFATLLLPVPGHTLSKNWILLERILKRPHLKHRSGCCRNAVGLPCSEDNGCSVLFFSRPRSEGWPRHGGTCTFSIYLCHSDWLFHGESCPRLDVVHPGRAWSSSPACTWHCSLHWIKLNASSAATDEPREHAISVLSVYPQSLHNCEIKKYSVGQKTGPQAHDHNSVNS